MQWDEVLQAANPVPFYIGEGGRRKEGVVVTLHPVSYWVVQSYLPTRTQQEALEMT